MFLESLGMFFMVFIQIWSVKYSRKRKFIQDLSRCRSNKKFKHVRVVPLCFSALTKSALTKIWLVKFQLFKKKVLAPFQRFMPTSAFYPHFSVLFLFIPISVYAFSFRFRVLSRPVLRTSAWL